MKTLMIVIFTATLTAFPAKAQDMNLKKNAIYGNVGVGGFYFTATAYYERIIQQNLWNKNIAYFIKGGIGAEAHWGVGGPYILGQFGIITGAKTNHLEISAGPNIFLSGDLQGDFLPLSAALGWRVQKPNGKAMFRMGAAWPEAVYIGFGFSF